MKKEGIEWIGHRGGFDFPECSINYGAPTPEIRFSWDSRARFGSPRKRRQAGNINRCTCKSSRVLSTIPSFFITIDPSFLLFLSMQPTEHLRNKMNPVQMVRSNGRKYDAECRI